MLASKNNRVVAFAGPVPGVGKSFVCSNFAAIADELLASRREIRRAGAEVKGVLFNGLNVEGRWYRSHYYFGKHRYISKYSTETKRA